MSFQAYLDSIRARTGKGADDFIVLARERGLAEDGALKPGVKPGAVVAWLQAEFGLGHGHAMAVVALLKGKRPEGG